MRPLSPVNRLRPYLIPQCGFLCAHCGRMFLAAESVLPTLRLCHSCLPREIDRQAASPQPSRWDVAGRLPAGLSERPRARRGLTAASPSGQRLLLVVLTLLCCAAWVATLAAYGDALGLGVAP